MAQNLTYDFWSAILGTLWRDWGAHQHDISSLVAFGSSAAPESDFGQYHVVWYLCLNWTQWEYYWLNCKFAKWLLECPCHLLVVFSSLDHCWAWIPPFADLFVVRHFCLDSESLWHQIVQDQCWNSHQIQFLASMVHW